MNYQEMDILQAILSGHPENQRKIAELSGCSIGIVNRSLKTLKEEGYVDDGYHVTEKAEKLAKNSRPKRAVILAAGYGMRMIPVQPECPKGLLTVHGEVLIEHTIRQLRKVGVKEIVVAVGFMLERYEYLTEEFGVKLVVCRDYATRNNLYSLAAAKDYLEEAYIVPSDIYCYRNPFHPVEFYPWYLAGKECLLLSRWNEALAAFGKCVEIQADDAEAHSAIGSIYLQQAHDAYANFNVPLSDPTYTKQKAAINTLYKQSCAAYEKARKFAEDRTDLWLGGLRETYFKLNRGRELRALERKK